MFRLNIQLLLLPLIVFATIDSGQCIRCYHCFGFNNTACNKDPFNSDGVELMLCPGEDNVCAKISLPGFMGIPATIHRSCHPRYDCVSKPLAEFCYECENDFCNSSPVLKPSFIVAALSLLKHCLL